MSDSAAQATQLAGAMIGGGLLMGGGAIGAAVGGVGGAAHRATARANGACY